MSISTTVSIHCDGCNHWEEKSFVTAAELRRELRAYDWRVARPGGKDFCPDCWEAGLR